jgi:hypothetical protein
MWTQALVMTLLRLVQAKTQSTVVLVLTQQHLAMALGSLIRPSATLKP